MSLAITGGDGPHAGQTISRAGAALDTARIAMVLVHGRGASAADILGLAEAFGRDDVAYFAPQATHHTWYPQRFLVPTAHNQPYLDSALSVIGKLTDDIIAGGIPAERIVLAGFSQGACLAQEYAIRTPRRWGGVVGLSGGLIGSDAEISGHQGSMEGTPVILGCSDVDAHIPLGRVIASGEAFDRLGAEVTVRIFPGMGHMVNIEEIGMVRELLRGIAGDTMAS
ncbi:alpha/beta hydrolase [Methylobrevis pamukkalensis]|uniref:Putative hydrolase n=1 Tax=Methylobrevis pamukkalensis TaxID=1439726 RepID=A0A1E3H495_9HYPH|nr:phospholipase [Methylobrevis pamukkalensis]ODN70341.1 putative hydrolase [Methylobrevis pamukkalensis]